MEKPQKPEWVVPNPQIPRTFGILNIIFGIILLLVGAFYAAMFFMAPRLTKQLQAQMVQVQATRQAEIKIQIAKLKEQEDTAKSDAEKQQLQAARVAIESAPAPDITGFNELSTWNIFSDRRLAIFYCSELGLGMLLNLLMIIAGGGLMALAEWGRRLALGVAWLKILRWIGMIIVTLTLVVPITMERMQSAFAKIEAQTQRGGAAAPIPMTELARISAISSAVLTVVGAVVACIYPAFTLWFLTHPRARAACLAVSSKPAPPGEPREWS